MTTLAEARNSWASVSFADIRSRRARAPRPRGLTIPHSDDGVSLTDRYRRDAPAQCARLLNLLQRYHPEGHR